MDFLQQLLVYLVRNVQVTLLFVQANKNLFILVVVVGEGFPFLQSLDARFNQTNILISPQTRKDCHATEQTFSA